MSLHAVRLIVGGHPPEVDPEASIGWDPPLRTVFLQGFPNPETGIPAVWLGTRLGEFPTLDALRAAASALDITIDGLSAAVIAAIREDAARPHTPSLAERLGLLA